MRHALILGAVSLLCVSAPVQSADRSFPFEAAVATNEASVYSGPRIDDYYATLALRQGDRVTVVREDFGGWYLIQPLADSHSWIPVADVEKKRDDLGMVTRETNDYIGSNVYSGELYMMHRLSRGEVVRITGRSTIRINSQPQEMYRIEPPRGEYRYIRSRDVLPADEFERQPDLLSSAQADRPATAVTIGTPDFGPIEAQPGSIQPVVEQKAVATPAPPIPQTTIVSQPKPEPRPAAARQRPTPRRTRLPVAATEGIATPSVGFRSAVSLPHIEPNATPQELQLIDQAWQALQQIDAMFSAMVQRPIAEWDLTAIENRYRVVYGEYETAAGADVSPLIVSRVNQRLAAVDRRRRVYDEYSSFQQIMQRTEVRDAAIRQQYLSRFSVATPGPTRTIVRRPEPALQANQPATQQTAQPPRRASVFDGAGIVQRSTLQRPGLPTHVLLAPDGRVLTFLTAAPGIQLDRYLGHSMGIRGPRQFRRELNADLLAVHQLTPVTLRTR